MKGRQARTGFTLIELLVVVVIIGILASVGAAGYNQAMDRARNGGMISNTRSVLLGIEQWKTDHTGLPAELVAADHTGGVAANAPGGATQAAFPIKYVPGGYLPKAPWSKFPQTGMTAPFSCAGNANYKAQDIVDEKDPQETNFYFTKEGWWADGGEGVTGAPPPVNMPPTERKEYGYVYYVKNDSSGRYAVLGVGKVKNAPQIVAIRANFQ